MLINPELLFGKSIAINFGKMGEYKSMEGSFTVPHLCCLPAPTPTTYDDVASTKVMTTCHRCVH